MATYAICRSLGAATRGSHFLPVLSLASPRLLNRSYLVQQSHQCQHLTPLPHLRLLPLHPLGHLVLDALPLLLKNSHFLLCREDSWKGESDLLSSFQH